MATYTGSDRRLAYLFANGGGGGGSCKVISGYYHNGDFYEDQSYTQVITGDRECVYIDLDTTTSYLFDGTNYEVQGGGGGGSTVTITPTLSTGTKIADYSINGASGSLYAPNGGGSGSDGTVGVRIDKSFATYESKTYTYDELGITDKGYYILGIASNHAENGGGWKWYGYLCYSGNTTNGYSYVKPIDYNNISVTMDSVNKTITIQNTNGNWAETFRIEVLPIHPKFNLGDGGYKEDVFISANSSVTRTLTELNILDCGIYFISFIAPATDYWCFGYLVFKNSTESYAQSIYVSTHTYGGSSISYNESNRTLTFTNGSQWGVSWRIEVLSLHPKIEVEKPKVFQVAGLMIGDTKNEITGRGSATITLDRGIARIEFAIYFLTGGSTSNNFNWGISAQMLHDLNTDIPIIRPMLGGTWDYYSWDNSKMQYTPVMHAVHTSGGSFWLPARYYDSSDYTAEGSWPSTAFSNGVKIHGVCYGTY